MEFKFFTKDENKRNLQTEIDSALEEMSVMHVDGEDYTKAADNVEKLFKAKSYEDRLSKDTLVGAAASVIGILLILNFEKLDAVTSKAMQLLVKPRI